MSEDNRAELSELSIWLCSVIDGLSDRIFGRVLWAEVLGLELKTIDQWLIGTSLPSPEDLDDLLFVLESDWENIAELVLKKFSEISTLPIEQTAPGWHLTVPTLGHYRSGARRR